MLSTGQYLRWHGIQSWQLGQVMHTAFVRGVELGITPKEIERIIRLGDEHGEEGGKNQKNYGHYGHMNPNFDEKTGQASYNQGNTEAEADEDEKKLALMLSGTPEQLVNFIRTLEEGMYSRFMFCTMSPTYQWKTSHHSKATKNQCQRAVCLCGQKDESQLLQDQG